MAKDKKIKNEEPEILPEEENLAEIVPAEAEEIISDEEVVSEVDTDVSLDKEAVSDEEVVSEDEPEESIKELEKKEIDDLEVYDENMDENLKSKTIKQTGDKGWYVIHSYAGYEDQVSENLKQRIETLHMQEKIFNVLVPKEKQIEIKNGKRRTVERRIFPGYVMVEMIVTDDSWYVVRNTPNVTGFIGMGVRPTPMGPDEVERIMKRMGVQESKYKIELDIDDLIKIVDGPLKGFEGKVTEVDEDKGKVKVSVNMFGRETPVNLDSLQVKKV